MSFTNDSMLPENQLPLIITVAPYGPQWLPSDFPEDIPVTWEEQTQKALDCYSAGATVLQLHVRDPKTGKGSKGFNEFSEQIARLRKAVPKMIIQVGGSISFAPANEHEKAHWLGYDTRHMLAELNPKPEQVTIVIGTTQMNILDLTTSDDVQGTHLANPAMQAAYYWVLHIIVTILVSPDSFACHSRAWLPREESRSFCSPPHGAPGFLARAPSKGRLPRARE